MIVIEDLKNLATISGPCLTILEPVRDPVSQVTKAGTRLIAAAQQADELLTKKGLSGGDRESFLQPIRKFALNTDWVGRSGSVAIFRAPGFTQATFLPDILEPLVRLGDQFLILPLLKILAAERNYWVLALTINRIHLFRGKDHEFTEIELPVTLARSLADFTGLDKPDHDLEARSAKGPSSGAAGGVHFGTTNVAESEAAHLHDYFKTIDRTIHPILIHANSARNGCDPLVLAAVPRELALYRTVNTYSPLVEESIHGSPDALGFERLHKTAIELVAGHTLCALDRIRKEMDAAASRKLLLTDPVAILDAARLGQVARLFINRDAIASASGEIVNSAALAVIHNSGTVTSCEGQVTSGGVAGILRYRAEDEHTSARDLAAITAG
jgi:hypothetical protein